MKEPFDNRKFVDYAINHVNEDHRLEMIQIVKTLTPFRDVEDVTVMDYHSSGMELLVHLPNQKEQYITLPFEKKLESPQEFRPALIAMVNKARQLLKN
mgnify:CR=1 FL=1|nr:DUF2470 domain-containing protein [uncultured Allomuricauda sp.]